MIAFREVIVEVLAPYSIGLIFLTAGLVFLWFSRRQVLGKVFVSFGTCLLLFFGQGLIWQSVLPPLEGRYDALAFEGDRKAPIEDKLHSVKWVVVLSGGYHDEQRLPFPDRL